MNTKQTLIEAYLSIGSSKGFDNVSLQDIANSANIRKASIFSHFKDYDDLKSAALSYCIDILESKVFEINPKAADAEELILNLINSFIDVFADFPISALLNMIAQKRSYDPQLSVLSDRIDLMITSRFQVALDFCVQRAWSDSDNTDDLAVLFGTYFRRLLEKESMSDEDLSDMLHVFLKLL